VDENSQPFSAVEEGERKNTAVKYKPFSSASRCGAG